MPTGPVIRKLFGPYERSVTEAYRRIFVDLDDLARLMKAWVPEARRILEVGCGEGAMTERIIHAYPSATVTAIDVSPRVGRLFRGPRSNVCFNQETVETVALREPASFDLVVLADVMHHVPIDMRRSLLSAIAHAMAPDGSLVFKDWLISATPIHWLCGASDRYLTGDRVSYFTRESMDALLTDSFDWAATRARQTVRPWPNNLAVLVRPLSASDL
jgi:2-polyprenyl-3-methyl-5-hydroxy-6-metoxy-1,4-benzoquinol methylase